MSLGMKLSLIGKATQQKHKKKQIYHSSDDHAPGPMRILNGEAYFFSLESRRERKAPSPAQEDLTRRKFI